MGAKYIVNFVMYVILLLIFLGLINMIFDLKGIAFILEFLILMGLILIALLGSIGISSNSKWAWKLMKVFFAFVFLDILLIFVISTKDISFLIHFLVIAAVGFFISSFSSKDNKSLEEKNISGVKKKFTPGKFIASKTGSKFHSPKCDWGKRVLKKNSVWFNSKADAKKAGYKADTCIN
jgi:hypothetical protein